MDDPSSLQLFPAAYDRAVEPSVAFGGYGGAEPPESLSQIIVRLGTEAWRIRPQIARRSLMARGWQDWGYHFLSPPPAVTAMAMASSDRRLAADPHAAGILGATECFRALVAAGAGRDLMIGSFDPGPPESPAHTHERGMAFQQGLRDAGARLGVTIGDVYGPQPTLAPASAGRNVSAIGAARLAILARPPADGDVLVTLGSTHLDLESSLYLSLLNGGGGRRPQVDLAAEKISAELVRDIHAEIGGSVALFPIGIGGLALAAADMAGLFSCGIRLRLDRVATAIPSLFSEGSGRYLLAIPESHHEIVDHLSLAFGVDYSPCGSVGGEGLCIRAHEQQLAHVPAPALLRFPRL